MSDSPRPIPIARRPQEGPDRLESWKEIAGYLGREVRTVQGWEKNEGLPVHRHQHAKQGSVYALKAELDAWREARKGSTQGAAAEAEPERRPVRRWTVWLVSAGIVIAIVAGVLWWRNRQANASGQALSSVVVLPFVDMSPQKDQEYFSDGLTEEIIDALSRVPNLRVVARTSAFAFKGKAADVRQIGQQLNVVAVLEGSVRKAGDELRITAQLNRVSDGTHLWSRTYDRKLRDVFAVQQEISQTIADQLRAGDVPKGRKQTTSNLQAYDRYQEGLYFFNQHEVPESYWKAIERYQQAIRLDPNFARAYAGMADAYAYLAENFAVWPKEVLPKAKQAAEQAVALDDNLAEAHTSRGIVKMDFEWDLEGARREFQRALQLDPGSGWVHHWVAHSLEAQGRLDDATKEMQVALALDPLSIPIHWDIANELLAARKFDDAVKFLEHAEELFPGYPIIEWERAAAYELRGDRRRAVGIVETLLAQNPDLTKEATFLGLKGMAAAWAGRPAEARAILTELEQIRKKQYVEPLTTLLLCSALGDHDSLMLWIKRAYEDRSTMYLYAPMSWFFYNDDAGVKAFLEKTLPKRGS
ncbi:MAG: tetratricopeptide repeat protein [Acidobacteriia bacterium]|nr:tetratricopeptide repeat protein [Terriglobia bacterium]